MNQPRRKSILLLFIFIPAIALAQTTSIRAPGNGHLFQFRNGFWINLHHYLYAEALASQKAGNPRILITATKAAASASCAPFSNVERATWNGAVGFYSAHYVTRDVLFDPELVRINDLLGNTPSDAALPEGVPPALREQLLAVAQIYRRKCWTRHSAINQRWIETVHGLVARYGDAMATRLASIYQTSWPSSPIPVDAVVYANWAGAYTTLDPAHITASSTDSAADADPGNYKLETVFHEASHVLEPAIKDRLRAAFAQHHSEMPHQFDHALIFFTTGFITRSVLSQSDPGYEPFADHVGLYRRVPYWQEDEIAFRRFWQSYLEGREVLESALDKLAVAICCDDTPVAPAPHPVERDARSDHRVVRSKRCPPEFLRDTE